MTQHSTLWIEDYIKKHRDSETRYEIDLHLLRKGYDAETIEEGWKVVSAKAERKKFSIKEYLFPLIFIGNVLSVYSIFFIPWESQTESTKRLVTYPIGPMGEFSTVANQWGIDPVFLVLPLLLWTLINVETAIHKTYNTKYFKEPLICGLALTAFMLLYTLITIVMAFSHLNWPGPLVLTVSLVVGLISTSLNLKHMPWKSIVSHALSSK